MTYKVYLKLYKNWVGNPLACIHVKVVYKGIGLLKYYKIFM
jgi:hypothetical protein